MYLVDASLACNFKCLYCYSEPLRECALEDPDIEAIEAKARELCARNKTHFTLHGGEPLCWDKKILRRLLKLSHELGGKSCIQTNGSLISSSYIDMFREYKTSVGVSFDGLWPLNSFRTDESTTRKVMKNIELLKREEIPCSVISVISKANGLKEQRSAFKDFIIWARDTGISGRMNPCIHTSNDIQLSEDEFRDFYADIAYFLMARGIGGWSPFSDIVNSMSGNNSCVVCSFRGCDPYTTPAGTVITSRGEVSVCHKFHDEVYFNGMTFVDTRSDVLKQTDCKDCKYWDFCHGGCPAAAVGFDWRNKTRMCSTWITLFGIYERVFSVVGKPVKDSECTTEKDPKDHADGTRYKDGPYTHLDSDNTWVPGKTRRTE